MQTLLYILSKTVSVLIFAEQICMLARALLSFISQDDSSGLARFLYAVTEPVIMPVRAIVNRFDSLASMPIDISFTITYLLLWLISIFL